MARENPQWPRAILNGPDQNYVPTERPTTHGPPPSPPIGVGVAPATPTPSCCLGPAGPSAAWRASSMMMMILDDVAHKLRPQRMDPEQSMWAYFMEGVCIAAAHCSKTSGSHS